ncbi:Nuclear receptor coactivator 7, partial [Stegodyphus mimosarum]
MSTPTRQRSLRERIQSASRGIGISWQGKKSKSYHSKESLAEAQSSESDSATTQDQTETRSTEPDHQVQADTATSAETVPETASKDEGPSAAEKKALSRTFTQPQGTEQYKVEANDTLAGIAARFDTTPSELAKLNRLSARIVFPGQLLFVPEKRNRAPEATENQETTDSLAPPQDDRERRPSVTDALRIPYRRPSERSHRFLKVKARHFTDGQGVVAGVLIITPNAVMFDPNVSDPLVIEHGVESYGVIAPLDMLMRAAIYFDIAHMKVQHASVDSESRPKADVYYGRMDEETTKEEEEEEKQKMEEEKKVERPNRFSLEEAPSIEVAPAEEDKPPKNKGSELPATETQHVAQTSSVNAPGPASGDSIDSTDAEVSDAFAQPIETQVQESTVPSESRRERMLKRLSYPMESITSISRILTSSPKSFVDFSGSLFSGRGSEEETKEEQLPEGAEEKGTATIGYQNLVEEKPEIFETFDKLLQKKPGEEAEGPPLYLCLRMGIPKERKPQASPVLSYGKKRARSEYWFSIPHSRVEDLYNFLQQWIPSLYGDVDDVDPDEAGFIPIDDSLPDDEEEEEQRVDVEEGGERKAPRSFLKLVEEHFGFKSISPGD